ATMTAAPGGPHFKRVGANLETSNWPGRFVDGPDREDGTGADGSIRRLRRDRHHRRAAGPADLVSTRRPGRVLRPAARPRTAPGLAGALPGDRAPVPAAQRRLEHPGP